MQVLLSDVYDIALRDDVRDTFLEKAISGSFSKIQLPNDCSPRLYFRVTLADNSSLILMDSDPDLGEDIRPFLALTYELEKQGFTVPKVISVDINKGLALLSDMGDNLFNTHLNSQPADEMRLYKSAVELLVHVQEKEISNPLAFNTDEYHRVFSYGMVQYLNELKVFLNWYVKEALGRPVSEAASNEFIAIWRGLLTLLKNDDPVLVLRDFHADNLFWYAKATGISTIGLIDYQDALFGHPAYDLVSLLEDARRDVSDNVVTEAMRYYMILTNEKNEELFKRDYAILAAQRNLKILGIFMRMARHLKRDKYLDYLPRVWRYLNNDLKHPALAPVRDWLDRWIPIELRIGLKK